MAMRLLGEMYSANYDKAVRTVYGNPVIGQKGYEHVMQFTANLGRTAYYKAAQVVNELSSQVDKKNYDQQAKEIGKKYNRFQAVEHNSTVARSRTAKQYESFQSESRLYPNIEWLRTRSNTPREAHLAYVGLILPKNHPFWRENQPGNLYGCKCDWRTTDADTSAEPLVYVPPAPGLDGNPYETGEIFTKSHPYFEHAKPAKVNSAIASMPVESTYKSIAAAGRKQVRYNILHSKDALAKNAEVANDMLKLGYTRVDILPDIHQKDAALRKQFLPAGYNQRDPKKNPEAVMYKGNEVRVSEFKVLTGERNFINHIRAAAKQADYCVLKLKVEQRKKLTDRYIKGWVEKLKVELNMKGITVLDSDGKIIYQV